MDGSGVIVVTGASGYVGSHCVQLLLSRGYTVHATVRDKNHAAKTAFLRQMPGASDRLRLFSADLTADGAFDEALQGATSLIHTAASVMLTAKDPQKQIVDVTVNGTQNVLSSCVKAAGAGTFRRFVQISSIAAIQDNNRPVDHTYTEIDFNESATVARDPYSVSKLLSERLATNFVAELPPESCFTCAFVNPGAIYGPILDKSHVGSSPSIIYDLMRGKIPMAPQLGFPSVDVRDVALAAQKAVEQSEFSGRVICVEDSYDIKQLAALCKKNFPQYKFPTRTLPNTFMYLGAIFDKRITFAFLRDNLGKCRRFSNGRITQELNFQFRSMEETLRDTCQSLLDLGLVTPRP